MPVVKYIPVNYYSYNTPIYVASIIALLMYFVFTSILYSIFKYELLNLQNICDPAYYYGKGCRNMMAKEILLDPQFIDAKRKFYNAKDTITYEFIPEDQKMVDKSEKVIDENVKMTDGMIQKSIQNIQFFSENVNNVFQKYLGNMDSLLYDTSLLSKDTLTSFSQITQNLKSLMDKVQENIIDPAFVKYTDPLKKLYISLKTTYESSLPFEKIANSVEQANSVETAPSPSPMSSP